jgi:bifunctional ADP-heptose synthase (sugar kinase/adenylyltransferase)
VISDYNKWVFTRELFEKLKEIWDKKWIKILVDSKPKNYEFISWVYLLKPNFKEFIEIIWKDLENTDENIEKYWIKLAKIKNSNIVITRWAKWASLIELNWKITHTKTEVKQVFDVTGAWDTFISAVVYALFVWKNLQESIELGNKASSIVVWKVGTEKISKEELWI